MATHNMLDYALRYRRRGFSVIPCGKDKKSLIKWQAYQLQKPTEDEIKEWWSKWPDANIAITCGQVSGVDVLDVDTEEAYTNLQEFFLSDTFQTPSVKTPKGRHLYFKHRPGLSNAVRVVAGTDLRTVGGYVVAPPSRNGKDTPYYWLEGLGLKDCDFSDWPESLFSVLQQGSNPYNNTRSCSSSLLTVQTSIIKNHANQESVETSGDIGDKRRQYFVEGSRDQDLFHVANALVKGRCKKEIADIVLKILGNNCIPPFNEKELDAKLKSAEARSSKRERNLAAEVREWVLATNGDFSATNCDKELQTATFEEKKNINTILRRLSKENPPLIEKAGNKNGWWRLIDQDCTPEDWINADCSFKSIWLPLGLGEICGVQPGNVLIFAGAKDAGKTAFLMNIAKENRHKFKVHYFNSEMGKHEFKLRAMGFDDISLSQWNNFYLYNKSNNLHNYVKKEATDLNIIDYLEVPEEAYRIGPMIKRIHENLGESICVIGLQKKIGQDIGRGGEFSMEKARLYVSMEYGKAKIISCKNFKPNELIKGNPRGYTARYKLVGGCKIIKEPPGWTSELKMGT